MSQKMLQNKMLQNKMLQNVFRKKQKKCLRDFRVGYGIFDLVVGPFLGYNTKSVALGGFANIYAIAYKHCTQNAFCRNMYKRLSHINCMGNQVEDFTTNSKVALAFPTCAPCDCDQNRVQFDKVPYKG